MHACTTQDGNTALHFAVMMSHKSLVELLCEEGAPIDKTDNVNLHASHCMPMLILTVLLPMLLFS